MWYQSIMKKLKELIQIKNFPILFLIVSTIWLRLANLGYSDYQGDETKALFRPLPGQTDIEFLLAQRKGPVQFIITYLTSLFDPSFLNQFLFRLPFALAGIAAVYFFYKFVKLNFGKKIALYSSLFFSFNGILVAFSRIVQYQSVTILFFILTLYLFSLTLKDKKWEVAGWYLGMVTWAISILSHYDGGFIAPFAAYILFKWFKQASLSQKDKIKHILLSGILFLAITGSFFVPYVSNISDSTKDYWLNRVSDTSNKMSSSIVAFKTYNPMYIFYAFVGLVAASLFKIKKVLPVMLWALFPILVWEVVTDVPGTHIYNYLIPLFVLAAFGITVIEHFIGRVIKSKLAHTISVFGVSILFVFAFLLSNFVFVDHTQEYPWEIANFAGRTIQKPNPIFHNSLFGFPYNRGWEEIREYVLENNNGHYATNERASIPRFYIGLPKSTDEAGPYISIINPQSFSKEHYQQKADYWGSKYEPDKLIYRNNKVVAEIFLMPKGNLDTIKELGY